MAVFEVDILAEKFGRGVCLGVRLWFFLLVCGFMGEGELVVESLRVKRMECGRIISELLGGRNE
jgi:hypothetical protein